VGPRGTLGTLLRSTLAQAGVVREVLERGAREGRARLDDARRTRRRDDALARLGEAVLEAVRAGEAQDLFDLPDVADALAELDGLDAGAEDPPERERDRDRDDDRGGGGRVWIPPGIRDRFDRRPERPPAIAPKDPDDDGTVSSGARSRRPADEPGARFQERPRATPIERPAPTARPTREPAPPAPPARKGGIQFAADDDDDEDLSQYMHPDDVPPKPTKSSDDETGD
jgi:hypothetical protein